MMTKAALALAAMLLGSAAIAGSDYKAECRLGSGDPKGSRAAGTQRIVEAPTLELPSGEDSTLLVGGHVKIGAEMVPVGREVEVTATSADNGAVKVRVVLKLHSVVGGPGAQQVTTAREESVATIQPGGTVRVMIGQDPRNRQWADVTVRKLK